MDTNAVRGYRRGKAASGLLLAISLSLAAAVARAQATADGATGDLTALSLSDLLEVRIISPSKKPERLATAAAAVHVITREEIRRSGATSIPDLLRTVPGVHVARRNTSAWSISVRGFNRDFSRMLLVIIDGRTEYTPTWSGVHWPFNELLLEDIERIEVHRGPGASVWGANAINGVINIVTRHARDTQGTLAFGAAGTDELAAGGARHGGSLGDTGYYRVWAKVLRRDELDAALNRTPRTPLEDSIGYLGGVRLDIPLTTSDALLFLGQVDRYEEEGAAFAQSLTPPYRRLPVGDNTVSAAFALGRWDHTFAGGSESSVQVYFDHFDMDNTVLASLVDTLDLSLQHRVALGSRNDLVWGADVRCIDHDNTSGTVYIVPDDATYRYGLFAQDEITLVPEHLGLTREPSSRSSRTSTNSSQPRAWPTPLRPTASSGPLYHARYTRPASWTGLVSYQCRPARLARPHVARARAIRSKHFRQHRRSPQLRSRLAYAGVFGFNVDVCGLLQPVRTS